MSMPFSQEDLEAIYDDAVTFVERLRTVEGWFPDPDDAQAAIDRELRESAADKVARGER